LAKIVRQSKKHWEGRREGKWVVFIGGNIFGFLGGCHLCTLVKPVGFWNGTKCKIRKFLEYECGWLVGGVTWCRIRRWCTEANGSITTHTLYLVHTNVGTW